MVDVYVDVDLRDVVKGIDGMSAAAKDLRPVWQHLLPAFKKDQRSNFGRQEGPEGKWPKRVRPRYTKAGRGRRRKRRQMKLLGKLRTAWKTRMDRDQLEAYSLVDWSGVHQDGGVAGRGARIPQRTHLWVSNELHDLAVREIELHLVRGWAP